MLGAVSGALNIEHLTSNVEHLPLVNFFPHIHSPWWGLLIVLVVLGVIVAWRLRRPTLRVSSAAPYRAAMPGKGGRPFILRIPALLYALGLTSLVFALMRPQAGIERTVRRAEGVDIMLALDVSGSMKSYDIGDEYQTQEAVFRGMERGDLEQRIEVARQELIRFVRGRPNDRIGLIAFSRFPYVACPPTLDHDFLLENLRRLDIGLFPDMTGIAGPIAAATNRLKESDAKRRVLVLFTDGDNNVDAAATPRQAAELAAEFDIVVYTVGIGSRRSVVFVDTPFGQRLRGGISTLNDELLRDIADATGGRYFEARDPQAFRDVMDEIDKLEKTTLEQPVYTDYHERFLPWAIGGLVLCLAAFFLENTTLQELP